MNKGQAEIRRNLGPQPLLAEGRVAPTLTEELIEVKNKRQSWYDTWSKIKRWSLIQLSPRLKSGNFRSRGLGKT